MGRKREIEIEEVRWKKEDNKRSNNMRVDIRIEKGYKVVMFFCYYYFFFLNCILLIFY